ncbi:MAG: TOBE domain-containing protein [Deltaproteobacteria bacterium]|jgi:molybdate transport system regulatory protein|nr:TOBE domain-containing protein [Deltaproteobacteria bacterium]
MREVLPVLETAGVEELRLLRAQVEDELRRRDVNMAHEPHDDKPRTQRELYAVADGVKHMTSGQLDLATQSFRAWFRSSRTPVQYRSRGRVLMSFLLIRYGALRLGELLSLDDLRDTNLPGKTVSVGGSNARTIRLPDDVSAELSSMLKSPMYYTLRGKIFQIDQGYLRRKFYERAKECALPGYLLNPRVTRQSRGIELLRAGMPVKVVQTFMGWQSQDQATGFLELSDSAFRGIVERFMEREARSKTSARNVFSGKVESVIREGILAQVTLAAVSGLKIISVITEESLNNLGLAVGSSVTAVVKAPWIGLEKIREPAEEASGENFAEAAQEADSLGIFPDRRVLLNVNNNFSGTVTRVALSETVAEVLADLPDGHKVCALVTRESAERLELKPGSNVLVSFRSLAVVLNV